MVSALTSRLRAGPWPFILVVVLAAVARLAALTLIDYRYDEAAGVHFAFGIADGRLLTLAPHSGSIATHPPLTLYVMALPALLARDVLWVAGFRAALDVVAVGAMAWLASRTLGRVAGFVSALAYAAGPWAIYFARKTWVSPIGLFGMLALMGAFLLVGQQRARGWPIATIGVALAIGAHLSGLYLLPGLALVLLLGWRRLNPTVFLAGLIPLVIVGVGYAVADAPTGFGNLQALLRAQNVGGMNIAAFNFALWQTSAAKLAEISGLPALLAPEGSVLDLVNVLPQALTLFGIGLSVVAALRDRTNLKARAALVAAGFWVSIVLVQLRTVGPPQPHYVQLAMPAAFALIGYSAAAVWKWAVGRRKIWLQFALAGALLGVAGFELAYWSALNGAAAGAGPFAGYRPIAAALEIAQSARTLAAECPSGEILIGVPGANPEIDDAAAVFGTLLADRRPRLFDSREVILAPSGCAIWVIAQGGGPALTAYGVVGDGVRRVTPPQAGAPMGEWANGIELVGAGLSATGSAWATATLRVSRDVTGREDVHWFARLESGGSRIASRDIAGVPPRDWRVGDTIGLLFDFGQIPIASGDKLLLRIGSYEFPGLAGIGVRVPDGAWVDSVAVPVTIP